MVSIILSTKLCIIQFYSKVLAFVKLDLTCHPQVILLRGIFSKIFPRKTQGWGRGAGGGGGGGECANKKHVSQKIFVHFT